MEWKYKLSRCKIRPPNGMETIDNKLSTKLEWQIQSRPFNENSHNLNLKKKQNRKYKNT